MDIDTQNLQNLYESSAFEELKRKKDAGYDVFKGIWAKPSPDALTLMADGPERIQRVCKLHPKWCFEHGMIKELAKYNKEWLLASNIPFDNVSNDEGI
jgi:hypothetical protein